MHTIARHMYGRLILATLAVTLLLASTQVLAKSHDLYRLVLASVISVGELLTLWAALLPVVFYHAGPQMVVLGVVAQYYLWRQHNEILSQRSAGRSCWQIAGPGIAVGISMGLVCAFMSLCALPRTFGDAEDISAAAEVRITPSLLEEGVPNRVLPKLSISFRRWVATDTIEGVVMTDDRAPGEFAFVTAEHGRFVKTDGVYVLVLKKGSNFIHSASGEVRHVAFEELSVPLKASEARKHGRGYYEETIGRLLNPPPDVRKDRHQWAAWVMEGHHRIINPLRCIGCVLLVLGILIPGRQGNSELVVRLIVALCVSFGEDSASTIAFAIAQERVEAAPLLYLLPLASGGIGALLLWSGDRHLKHALPWPKWHGFAPRPREAAPQAGAD